MEKLLNNVEAKLQDLKQVLPRLDLRRGLINLGGTVLQVLFGAATVADIEQRHQSIDELHQEQNNIAHYLNQQVTYLWHLDATTAIHQEAIVNLSSTVNDTVFKSHERFKETTRDILWLNMTVHSFSETYMAIRQLEFALLQIILQFQGLVHTVETVLLGKMPVTLMKPHTLHSILRNV